MNNKKVLVAMSGGVDSAVCAYLIKSSGYITEGMTMRLWSRDEVVDNESYPLPDKNCNDAKAICDRLGIEHRRVALGRDFKQHVIDKFICDYISGLTPNPCVECNKRIKFGAFAELARSYGFDAIATGHYAKIDKLGDEYVIRQADDKRKDQSYFLWSIKKELLPHILFPLGTMTKDEIRAIARENNFECADRSDSQDICFIENGDYASFIREQTGKEFPQGDFISPDGKILGKHTGIINYTVGQRKGLGIAVGRPIFVGKKNADTNTVTLCDDRELYSRSLTATSVNILTSIDLTSPKELSAKIRYRHEPAKAMVSLLPDGRLSVEFEDAQRAITPGQSVVLYDGDILVGGGIIE